MGFLLLFLFIIFSHFFFQYLLSGIPSYFCGRSRVSNSIVFDLFICSGLHYSFFFFFFPFLFLWSGRHIARIQDLLVRILGVVAPLLRKHHAFSSTWGGGGVKRTGNNVEYPLLLDHSVGHTRAHTHESRFKAWYQYRVCTEYASVIYRPRASPRCGGYTIQAAREYLK
jgi:hypothetical protein